MEHSDGKRPATAQPRISRPREGGLAWPHAKLVGETFTKSLIKEAPTWILLDLASSILAEVVERERSR